MKETARVIPLTQGQFTTVSIEDYKFLMQWKWCAHKQPTTYGFHWRVVRGERRKTNNSKTKLIYMHREIAKRASLPYSKQYDHKDRNGLNNTRENLRPCTCTQNRSNATKSNGTSSEFKGASWCKRDRKWTAQIKVKRKKIHLGSFSEESDAARAYAQAAVKYYGEFACW